jgi:hypothetical protein
MSVCWTSAEDIGRRRSFGSSESENRARASYQVGIGVRDSARLRRITVQYSDYSITGYWLPPNVRHIAGFTVLQHEEEALTETDDHRRALELGDL